jgi:predicted ATPase
MRALLAARLDTLPENDRRVLEAGAVVGTDVRADELDALAGVAHVADALDRLVRKQLLDLDGDIYRFAHQLVREAAYEAIPKRRRAELHEQVAERLHGNGELEGVHLEQAARYRFELDPNDPRAASAAMRASKLLGAAGQAADVRGEVRTAVALLRRALGLPFQDVRVRAERLADLGAALREAGELTEAERTIGEAVELAETLGDRATAARARLTVLRITTQTDPEADLALIAARAEQALQELEERGDDATLADAWFLLAWTSFVRGKVVRADEALERSMLHAERAGARVGLRRAVNLFLGTGVFGPTPVDEAVARCEATLAGEPERATEAAAYRALGALRMMQGDFDAAHEFLLRDAELCDDLGLRVAAASASEHVATIQLHEGDLAAAEETARAAYEALDALGDTSAASTLVAILAETVFRQGRLDEAISWTEVSESLAAAQDVISQIKWRATRAKALAHSGDAAAERLAREAVAIARDVEMPLPAVEALLALAEVLKLAGADGEARGLAQEAVEVAERKGDRVGAAAAAALA